jgi:hypothetical protein
MMSEATILKMALIVMKSMLIQSNDVQLSHFLVPVLMLVLIMV